MQSNNRIIQIVRLKHRDKVIYTTSPTKVLKSMGKKVTFETMTVKLTKKSFIDFLNKEQKRAA